MSVHKPIDSITRPEAQYLSLIATRLEHGEPRTRARSTKHDIHEAICDSGCIQLDSISVVSRAHETAIWSRLGAFKPNDLSDLHYPDVELFEYWAHAASLLPIAFFPHMRRQMQAYGHPEHTWYGKWAADNRDLLDHVLATIRDQGPVSTRAFARPEGVERSPWAWYGGKPAKQALDCLWTMGDLVVLKRVGFERVYELTERALPHAAPLPTLEEQNRFFVERALRAVGIGTAPWISDFFRAGTARYVSTADTVAHLRTMVDESAAFEVAIEGIKQPAWMDASLVPALDGFREGRRRPRARTLLSPFDNLLWRRDRALALFDFDYRLESYTPEPNRVYGYYTLPILIDGRLVGRLDPRYRRKEKVLSIQAIHLEPSIRVTSKLADAIAGTLKRFTAFLGGGTIEVLVTNPAELRTLLLPRVS